MAVRGRRDEPTFCSFVTIVESIFLRLKSWKNLEYFFNFLQIRVGAVTCPCVHFSSLTPSLQELLVLELGDQEIGSRVDSESAEVIARHCPRLQKLYMESCSWTDKEAILVGFCCPRLRFLKIAGNNSYSYCVFDFNIIKPFPLFSCL